MDWVYLVWSNEVQDLREKWDRLCLFCDLLLNMDQLQNGVQSTELQSNQHNAKGERDKEKCGK